MFYPGAILVGEWYYSGPEKQKTKWGERRDALLAQASFLDMQRATEHLI